jgi:hypothetical protein
MQCNGQAPICAHCLRRNEKCEYPSWLDPPLPSSSRDIQRVDAKNRLDYGSVATIPPSPYAGAIPPTISSVGVWLESSCLQHTFWPGQLAEEERRLWNHTLIINNSKHEYLRHCLASILCLYGEEDTPTNENTNHLLTYHHHLVASTLFRQSSTTVDQSNWLAVFIFSISTIVFQFASQQYCSAEGFDYIETLRVLKMSANVAISISPFLWQSLMWPWIQRGKLLASKSVDESVWTALCTLEDTVTYSVLQHQVHDKNLLLAVVQDLKKWALFCNTSPRTWIDYILFPSMLPADYLDLLSKEDDLALLILIHWCAIMRLGTERWFMRRWIVQTTTLARAKLRGDWIRVLQWPSSVLCDPVMIEYPAPPSFTNIQVD